MWREPGGVRAVLPDDEGTYAGGLAGLFQIRPDDAVVPVDLPVDAPRIVVNALARDRNGVLWVGHSHGLSLKTASGWKTLTEADGLPDDWVGAVHLTPGGYAWVGTEKGVVRLPIDGPWNETAMRWLTAEDGLLEGSIRSIAEDPAGGMWFGNYGSRAGGLSRLEAGRFWRWTAKDGLPHANVTALMTARDGRVWAACGQFEQGGAAVFGSTGRTWKLEATVPTAELAGPKVRSLYEDRHGRTWLGSEYDGLTIRSRDATLRILRVEDGLPAAEVMAIAEGKDGTIWLGTLGGLVRISPEAVEGLFRQPEERLQEKE